MAKRIIICADGTGNEPTLVADSNVFRLYSKLPDDSPDQVAFYDQGLGTDRLKALGKAFGVGISKNIRDCYEFLIDHYEPGDKVYLFGFSRGAFTVRSLGGLISRCGVVKKKYRSLAMRAFRLYRKGDKKENEALVFREKFNHKLEGKPRDDIIHFIGVWDTVGALGISSFKLINKLNPIRHRFHNTSLSPHVPFGYHALAIDDKRRTFHPTLWSGRDVTDKQTIEQLWFAGMHSDVGGGYQEQDLSDIALRWMMKKAESRGVQFVAGWEDDIKPNPAGVMHNSRNRLAWFYIRKSRNVAEICAEEGVLPLAHPSVHERLNNPDCDYNLKHGPDKVAPEV